MECKGTLTLPFRITLSCLLLQNGIIRTQIWPKTLQDLRCWKKLAFQSMSKALDVLSVTGQEASNLLKVLSIVANTPDKRSAFKWKKLEKRLEILKKATFLNVINKPVIYKF